MDPQRPDRPEDRTRVGFIERIRRHLQSKTVGGLVELLPIMVTAIVIAFLINNADAFVRPLPYVDGKPWDFPGIGIIIGVVIFYLIGLMVASRPGRMAMDRLEWVLHRIPVVGAVFGVAQKIMSTLSAQYNFSRVVFLEWPREGMIAMGFVTGRAYSTRTNDSMVVVYVPTVPNPTSGNMALVMEDDLIETDLSVEDAMKLVFSGGLAMPDEMTLVRFPRERPYEDADLTGSFVTEPKPQNRDD